MKLFQYPLILLVLVTVGCALIKKTAGPQKDEYWCALHLLNYNTDEALGKLGEKIPSLAEMDFNVLVLEIDYHFEFESHPELRMKNKITKEGVKSLPLSAGNTIYVSFLSSSVLVTSHGQNKLFPC